MRRKNIAVRLGAWILTASLVAGDVVPVLAMPSGTQTSRAYVAEVEETSEAASEETAEAVVEETTEVETEAAVEETTEVVTEATVEETTEVVTEATVEETTEVVTEATVEETTEVVTEATIEETTEVVTEETTESVTEAAGGVVSNIEPPAKIIGLKANPGQWNSFTDTNGVVKPYVYVKEVSNVPVLVAANDISELKDESTGLYKYNNQYYGNAQSTDVPGFYRLSNPVVVLQAGSSTYLDAATGLYKVNNLYFQYLGYINANMSYYNPSNAVTYVGKYADSSAFESAYGVDVDGNGYYDYYAFNGKCYKQYGSVWGSELSTYYVYNEISFEEQNVNFSWNSVSIDEKFDSNGNEILLGYEVLINGEAPMYPSAVVVDSDNAAHAIIGWNNSNLEVTIGSGEQAVAEVRALYYHYEEIKDEAGNVTGSRYVVDCFGEWADKVTYTATTIKAISAISGLKAVQKNQKITLTWNNIEAANGYYCQVIKSATPLNIKDYATFYKYYNNTDDTLDIVKDSIYPPTVMTTYYSVSEERPYMYFVMRVNNAASGYYINNSWSNVVSVTYKRKANVSKVKNFRVEKYDNGNSWQLTWNQVDANVVIYAFAEGKKPADIPYFNYELLNAYRVDTVTDSYGNTYDNYTYLSNKLTSKQKYDVSKYVRYITCSGMNGAASFYNLKPGVKYNFVAYTYDKVAGTMTPIGTDLDSAGFNQYTTMSKPSAMVSYTTKTTKPSVNVYADEDSVKLTMSASNATGYIIYRKDGSTYKKIATITDDNYTDTGLSNGKTYTYKVQAYYYNTLTKKQSTSEATIKSVTTSVVRDLQVYATKGSKTSVKLLWTKVKSATKYEIYRGISNYDPKIICKKLGSGSSVSILSNYKYELIKTISDTSTVKYTDSGLQAGEHYNYIVLAYYKDGSKSGYLSAGASMTLQLSTPQNVTGTIKNKKVTIKWDADKYANKYELRYKVYDKYGHQKTDVWKYATTKKSTFTLKNIASGEVVDVQVRSCGANKVYSYWSSVNVINSLATVSNIKAVNDANKGAVKITWKKVPGAKYYKVYRSTVLSQYNSDEKKYTVIGDFISKEANDNTSDGSYYNNSIPYTDYMDIQGSVVGTTVYDYARLDTGVKYYYYVVAYGEKGTQIASYMKTENGNSLASGKPGEVVVNASIKVELTNPKAKTVTVKFNKVPGANKYKVYRATAKNGKYTLVKTVTSTTYTDTNLKKGTTYFYKVEAVGINSLKANFAVTSPIKSIKVTK